jgi:hypothetical protein
MIPSIATKFQYVNSPFIFLLTHYMFRPLLAIFRWDIQSDTFKDYSCYNGSIVRTQLDVDMLYVSCRYFDSWSPIHVIKLSTDTKIVKLLKFSVKTGPIYKNVKILRWVGVCISSWWSGRSSKLCGLLVSWWSSCGQWRLFVLRLLLFWFSPASQKLCGTEDAGSTQNSMWVWPGIYWAERLFDQY